MVEINGRLCRLIPSKIWNSKQAERMDFYQRLELANISPLLHAQLILDTMREVRRQLPVPMETFNSLWTLEGERIRSLQDLHLQLRVLVVSSCERFIGVRGLDQFEHEDRPRCDTDRVRPKPLTWVQSAACKWLSKNDSLVSPRSYVEH